MQIYRQTGMEQNRMQAGELKYNMKKQSGHERTVAVERVEQRGRLIPGRWS